MRHQQVQWSTSDSVFPLFTVVITIALDFTINARNPGVVLFALKCRTWLLATVDTVDKQHTLLLCQSFRFFSVIGKIHGSQ